MFFSLELLSKKLQLILKIFPDNYLIDIFFFFINLLYII